MSSVASRIVREISASSRRDRLRKAGEPRGKAGRIIAATLAHRRLLRRAEIVTRRQVMRLYPRAYNAPLVGLMELSEVGPRTIKNALKRIRRGRR